MVSSEHGAEQSGQSLMPGPTSPSNSKIPHLEVMINDRTGPGLIHWHAMPRPVPSSMLTSSHVLTLYIDAHIPPP